MYDLVYFYMVYILLNLLIFFLQSSSKQSKLNGIFSGFTRVKKETIIVDSIKARCKSPFRYVDIRFIYDIFPINIFNSLFNLKRGVLEIGKNVDLFI